MTLIDFAPAPDAQPAVTKKHFSVVLGTKTDIEDLTVLCETGSKNIRYILLNISENEYLRIPSDPSSCDSDEVIRLFEAKRLKV